MDKKSLKQLVVTRIMDIRSQNKENDDDTNDEQQQQSQCNHNHVQGRVD
jgi:hypothetical protein